MYAAKMTTVSFGRAALVVLKRPLRFTEGFKFHKQTTYYKFKEVLSDLALASKPSGTPNYLISTHVSYKMILKHAEQEHF